jgi:hypothetical protein
VQFFAAAGWVLLTQLQNSLRDVRRGLRLANVPGPATAGLEASGTVMPVAPNPAANGVRAASKVTSRQTCVAIVLFVPVHH